MFVCIFLKILIKFIHQQEEADNFSGFRSGDIVVRGEKSNGFSVDDAH
jgi:hypothetical protein